MSKPYTCTEVTAEVDVFGYRVRVWIGTNGLVRSELDAHDIAAQVLDQLTTVQGLSDELPATVVEKITANVPYINAVQVINKDTGVGTMVYTTAFEDNDEERFYQPEGTKLS